MNDVTHTGMYPQRAAMDEINRLQPFGQFRDDAPVSAPSCAPRRPASLAAPLGWALARPAGRPVRRLR